MSRLHDKVALITGGTSGIGLAAARLFQAEGARVFVTGSNPAALDSARTTFAGIATVLPPDAGDLAQIASVFEQLRREADGLDVKHSRKALRDAAAGDEFRTYKCS